MVTPLLTVSVMGWLAFAICALFAGVEAFGDVTELVPLEVGLAGLLVLQPDKATNNASGTKTLNDFCFMVSLSLPNVVKTRPRRGWPHRCRLTNMRSALLESRDKGWEDLPAAVKEVQEYVFVIAASSSYAMSTREAPWRISRIA